MQKLKAAVKAAEEVITRNPELRTMQSNFSKRKEAAACVEEGRPSRGQRSQQEVEEGNIARERTKEPSPPPT